MERDKNAYANSRTGVFDHPRPLERGNVKTQYTALCHVHVSAVILPSSPLAGFLAQGLSRFGQL